MTHIYSLNKQLHHPEQQIVVSLRPWRVLQDGPWFALHRHNETLRLYMAYAYFHMDIRNIDIVPRTVSDIYVEVYSARSWRTPFRKLLGVAMPHRIDGDDQRHQRPVPSRVDWALSASSQAQTHLVHFEKAWDYQNPQTPFAPQQCDFDLVIEVGSRDRRRRWNLEKASQQ